MEARPGGPARTPALFVNLARASQRVASTRSRLQKKTLFVEALAKIPDEEVAAAVGWLVEEPLCGPLGVGPAQLWALSQTDAPRDPTVGLREVETALAQAKSGPREQVLSHVSGLFARLTQPERALFIGALTGSLRQGSLGGVMGLALVELSSLDEEAVRRAVMVTGSIPHAAAALVKLEGRAPPSTLELFRPIAPMLASPSESVESAFENARGAAAARLVEWKVDGVRAQVHKQGSRVVVFSRQRNDVTAGCAPVLDALAALNVESTVMDGEVVLLGPDGVARPFQDTFSAVASRGNVPEGDRLRIFLFDCMHRDGRDLVDEPLSVRLDALAAFAPEGLRMPATRATTVDAAKAFQQAALAAGHEGVMVKDLASLYRIRGAGSSMAEGQGVRDGRPRGASGRVGSWAPQGPSVEPAPRRAA